MSFTVIPISVKLKNDILTALTTMTNSGTMYNASIHSAVPDSSGSNIVGTKKQITWNAPSNGTMTQSNSIDFSVPASTTITHVGFWDNWNNFVGYVALDTSVAFSTASTLRVANLVISP
jgi:hypothetical protein